MHTFYTYDTKQTYEIRALNHALYYALLLCDIIPYRILLLLLTNISRLTMSLKLTKTTRFKRNIVDPNLF